MKRLAILALLAALPAAAEVQVTGPADALTFTLTSQSYVLTGEVASTRGRRERILLDVATVTRETRGEKGIQGTVEISARVADRQMPLLYSLRLPARAAALDESGLIAADLDDCCTFYRGYYDATTGERLFESSVPIASLALEGRRFKRRVAAFVAKMDGNEDHSSWGDNAIGLISYAAADRVIQQVLVSAEDPITARRLRSLDDERAALAWVDGRTGAPIVAVPDHGAVQPQLRLYFSTSATEVKIPLKNNELVLEGAPAGFTLKPRPLAPIAGAWRVATAVAAPWVQGGQEQALKNRYVLFAPGRVRSAGSVLDCNNASYDQASVPPDGLFQGAGLTSDQAASLGLTKPLSPSLTLVCDTGVFDLHATDDGRWLMALDNVIYGLEPAIE
jgi:hypothetical protein